MHIIRCNYMPKGGFTKRYKLRRIKIISCKILAYISGPAYIINRTLELVFMHLYKEVCSNLLQFNLCKKIP